MEDELISDESELLVDNEAETITEDIPEINDSELILSEDEETLFVVDDINTSDDLVESSNTGDTQADQQISDEVYDFPHDMDNLNSLTAEIEKVGTDSSAENDENVLQSLQIIQRNVKTGFDNLSLIGSVQTGLISFGIGAIIIYCYIGRFK